MTAPKQDTLPIKPGDKYSQKDITGKGTLKETTPKEVQTAADRFFLRKADFACAKTNWDKAADELLAVMGKLKITQANVVDGEGYKKRIVVKTGAEKLKVEKTYD